MAGGFPFDGGSCAVVDEMRAWVAAHQSCTADADCMAEMNWPGLFGSSGACAAKFALATAGDSGYQAILARWDMSACAFSGPWSCSAVAVAPSCQAGVCSLPSQ